MFSSGSSSFLLVSFDTLRADVAYCGAFPTIERLRQRGITFSRTVAAAPLTPPSHASVMSGRYPPNHGVRHLFKETIDPNLTLLAEAFQHSGYRTGGIVSCPGMNSWYGLDRGFETYDDEIPLLADGSDPLQTVDVKLRGTALKRADVVADRALDWLDAEQDKDFFLFLHFFDSHWPYEAPTTGLAKTNNAYEDEIAYMDHHLGRVLDGLEERGLLEDLTIVIFSDHGEDLNGWYANDKAGEGRREEEEGHGALLFDQTQMVMLVVSAPGETPAGLTIDSQVRLIDIAPTMRKLANLAPDPEMDGTALQPLWQGENGHRTAYFETFYREEIRTEPGEPEKVPLVGVRLDDRWKVVWEPRSSDSGFEVYDLEADPGEHHPVLRMALPDDTLPDLAMRAPDAEASDALERLPARARPIVDQLIEKLSPHATGGIFLTGSYADGMHDAYSDIDLTITRHDAAPDSEFRNLVEHALRSNGDILALFPASHLGMEDLFVSFFDTGGDVTKIDLNCVGPRDIPTDGILLTAALEPIVLPLPAANAAFPVALSWNRLIGWTHYCDGKIRRGELLEAADSLAEIRSSVAIAALQAAHNLPAEGARRLETRLPQQTLLQMSRTMPAALDQASLDIALTELVRLSAASLRVVNPDLADTYEIRLARMMEMIGPELGGK